MMMPFTPSLPGSALTSALVRLTSLDRGELTVIAAAAGALAAQRPSDPPQKGPSPLARTGRVRRRSTNHADPRGRQAEAERGPSGPGLIGDDTAASYAAPTAAGPSRGAAAGTFGGGAEALRLGGRGRLLACGPQFVDPELFSSQAYRRRLSATVPGLLYAAGCDGLLALAQRLDEPLFKVGVTEGRTTAMRMSTLAAERYGSVVRDGHGWREEDGFGHWRAVGLPLTKQRPRMSPVRPGLKAIAYECPASLPHGALDRAVAAALAPAGLARFATSDDGLAAYRARALDPATLDRYSPDPLGCTQGRTRQARELVLLGPRADADRLAAVLEAVIAAHVMEQDPA